MAFYLNLISPTDRSFKPLSPENEVLLFALEVLNMASLKA